MKGEEGRGEKGEKMVKMRVGTGSRWTRGCWQGMTLGYWTRTLPCTHLLLDQGKSIARRHNASNSPSAASNPSKASVLSVHVIKNRNILPGPTLPPSCRSAEIKTQPCEIFLAAASHRDACPNTTHFHLCHQTLYQELFCFEWACARMEIQSSSCSSAPYD